MLDCGCGTGSNLELLGRFGQAYGFDLTGIGLKIGAEAGRTRLVQATVTAAPFARDTFDIVTSFDVLYSLQESDERAAVAEMFRVAKPGGFAVVNVAAMESHRGDHSVLSREVRRQRRRGLSTEEHADQEIRVPAPAINVALTAALGIESLWVRLVDNPFGSSLLCLAKKPA